MVFTEAELPALCDKVASRDHRLRFVIDEFGYPPFWSRPNTFESFVWFILEQQVSLASAKAALEKLRERVTLITPENVLALSDDELRAAYFSRQKIGYVRGLAREIADGDLDLTSLENLPDAAIRERLVRLKGVGNWTVDVYLILALHRADVFPAGDLAVINGLKQLRELPKATTPDAVQATAQQWAPYRTIGTLVTWHYYLSRKLPPGAGTRF
ncbi:DNA-3-methyladenine glycosylase 2 family protein [Actinoplanes bogorensis]|uniref:DNA-3-methyladenine glycosylase II n=1 Tax=Paractinoplanes bogorensis TaxID=1610840 RepID=A0ABS5YV63_9ACTN|nr:DNA-3-methyladenine glycosylase 2 family protein [Actinoplanes bogorensis]MBU2667344.1 DNA-3-methyladenine glycosylase 2 family protein [Actinoplanes bogorensis]